MHSFAGRFKSLADRTAVFLALAFPTVYIAGCVGSSPRFDGGQKSAATQSDRVAVVPFSASPASNYWELETGMRFYNMPTNTVFRAYDAAFVQSIQNRWRELLKGRTSNQSGIVGLKWRLLPDGEVSDLQITRSTAGSEFGAMAEKMIREMAPFAPWPDEMRRLCSDGYRTVTFELRVP